MKHTRFLVALFLLLSIVALGQTPRPSHVMMSSGDLKWGDAPPVFPKGAKLAVLSGDPSTEGLFVVRLKLPAGYKVAPHWHPTDEQITVLKGTFALGMGDTLNAAAAKSLQ